jgi:hypothetical protein
MLREFLSAEHNRTSAHRQIPGGPVMRGELTSVVGIAHAQSSPSFRERLSNSGTGSEFVSISSANACSYAFISDLCFPFPFGTEWDLRRPIPAQIMMLDFVFPLPSKVCSAVESSEEEGMVSWMIYWLIGCGWSVFDGGLLKGDGSGDENARDWVNILDGCVVARRLVWLSSVSAMNR